MKLYNSSKKTTFRFVTIAHIISLIIVGIYKVLSMNSNILVNQMEM